MDRASYLIPDLSDTKGAAPFHDLSLFASEKERNKKSQSIFKLDYPPLHIPIEFV